MNKQHCTVEEWSGAPQMDSGAPMPAIFLRETQLFVAYMVSEPQSISGNEEYAVVRFDGVCQHTFGYPNDEALGGHPLYSVGLKFYAFNEVLSSPYLGELGTRNAKRFPGTEIHYTSLKHWIVTFHDETLEVIGHSVAFLGVVPAGTAEEAIERYAV